MSPRCTIVAAIHGTAAFALCLSCALVQAQVQDQTFRIRVADLVAINANSHFQQIVHDETDGNQTFDWQAWQVVCSNAAGAVLTFQTDQAFTNTTDSSYKRNVRLRLRKNGAPRWTVTENLDTTDYAGGDEVAIVQAETDQASNADFELRVVFLEEDFIDTLAGDYDVTVTGTIAPK